MGCRNTVFNASAQSGAVYARSLADAGFGALRIELVAEPPEVVGALLSRYHELLQGRLAPGGLAEWLRRNACPGGVGPGSLEVKAERAADSLRPTARRT